jgi:hypothetical protein
VALPDLKMYAEKIATLETAEAHAR